LFNSSDIPVSEEFENRLHLVTEVIYGDTIVVNGSNRVRFIDLDAPEVDECYY